MNTDLITSIVTIASTLVDSVSVFGALYYVHSKSDDRLVTLKTESDNRWLSLKTENDARWSSLKTETDSRWTGLQINWHETQKETAAISSIFNLQLN